MNGSATARKKRVGEYQPDPTLLKAVYDCRYLTTQQLMRLFPEIYATASDSDTTPKRHLRTLEHQAYLKSRRLQLNTPKVFSPRSSKLHRYLEQHYPNSTFHRTREEATRDEYLRHELAITDLQIDFLNATARHPNLTVLDQERRYFHGPNQLTYRDDWGRGRRLEPDLSLLLNINGSFPLLHFVEVDLGTESPLAFERKIDAYRHWYEQAGHNYLIDLYRRHDSPNPRPAFRLLIVTQARRQQTEDHRRLAKLYPTTQHLPAPLRKQTFFTTNQATTTARPAHGLLTAPIWYQARVAGGNPQPLFT